MLTLSQHPGESVYITLPDGTRIDVKVLKVLPGDRVIIGYEAPKAIVIDREKIWRRKAVERGELVVNGNV